MSKYDKYKESVFTHEEMQPMIVETDMTDMTDIVELLRPKDIVERLRSKDIEVMLVEGGPEAFLTLSTWYEAADEIERLREALKQVGLYAWQGDTFKIMDIVRETIIGKEK